MNVSLLSFVISSLPAYLSGIVLALNCATALAEEREIGMNLRDVKARQNAALTVVQGETKKSSKEVTEASPKESESRVITLEPITVTGQALGETS